MKIETQNSATAALHDRDCMEQGYRASFNDENQATVKAEVGNALAEKYAEIEAVGDPSSTAENGGKDPEDGDAADESGDGTAKTEETE